MPPANAQPFDAGLMALIRDRFACVEADPRAIAPKWVICYELGKAIRRSGWRGSGGRMTLGQREAHSNGGVAH